jgi:sarcosine oxidase subunit gamma
MSPLAYPRRSFVYRRLLDIGVSFVGIGDASLAQRARPADAESRLELVDLSVVPRWGLKGRDASSWLDSRGATMPGADNRAEPQRDGSLIARLSPAEFLILSPVAGKCGLADAIEHLPAAGEGACYPAPRRDSHCWFVLIGKECPAMLAKLCAVDLAAHRFPMGQVAQTSVALVTAIIIRRDVESSLAFHVLADSASAYYLWDFLLDAMNEFGGVVCGAEAVQPGAAHPMPAGRR